MARRRPSEPNPSVVRGAALVVAAVVVGLLLLRNGVDTTAVVTGERPTNGAAADENDTDGPDVDDPDATGTTEPAARPPAEVLTVVLNGSGVSGAAGAYTTALSDRGYQTAAEGNANERVEATQVFFTPGYEAEAQVLLTALGASGTAQPLPDPPPGEVGAADVVVVLGPDLASSEPPPDGGPAGADQDADLGEDGDEPEDG